MTDSVAHASRLDPIDAAISAVAAGRPVLVVDDEDRENEGDLIMAAEFADAATMGFFVRHTSGVICAPMTADRAADLRLPPMVVDNEDPKGTAYTISCDAVGVTTGISAAERAETGRVLAAADPDPATISRPGHIFPLIAKDGGVRERPGHTEAGVEFARLAGAQPVAMIAEVVHDDGSMMRFDAVRDFADANDLVMVSIEQLTAYLEERDADVADDSATAVPSAPTVSPASAASSTADDSAAEASASVTVAGAPGEDGSVEATAEVALPTEHGHLRARAFTINGHDHLGVFAGSPDSDADGAAPLVRLHSECLTGDVFGSHRCDCGEQLDLALDLIAEHGGAVLYLTGHEGRGIGLSNKLRAYALQDQGRDTVDANRDLGFTDDARDYHAAATILRSLGLTRVRLLTNNPAKTSALEELGITVDSVVPLEVAARPENTHYLATKRERMHHVLSLPEVTGTAGTGAGTAGAVAS
ncbi:GTP cyclohydrolase II [Brevibacterium limosum]|uniref:GTP cyclohydrolase II n=1 Tax=Brevibacterium limosum TaxID=2697565 RepID=UPI0014240044|nr:GTP cyclohydrolase II [Brevibacterium limosum]